MSVKVVYQSRGGHVREIAEIIGEGVEAEPISIDDPRAEILEPVDVLFIGGAIYKFKLDPSMVEYIKNLDADKVGMAICFGSSATTRRPIYMLQEQLKAKGIEVGPMGLYMRGKPKPYLREIGAPWAKREYDKYMKKIQEGTLGQEEAPIVTMIKAAEEKKEKKVAQVESEVAAVTEEMAKKAQGASEKRKAELEKKRAELMEKKAQLERELESLENEEKAGE